MEFLKILAVLVVCAFIVYGSVMMNTTSFSLRESFEAGTTASYAAQNKAQTVKLQDELLIDKYRSEYETAIVNWDDFVSCLLLKEALNVPTNEDKPNDTMQSLRRINELKACKDSLNVAMEVLDKQWNKATKTKQQKTKQQEMEK